MELTDQATGFSAAVIAKPHIGAENTAALTGNPSISARSPIAAAPSR